MTPAVLKRFWRAMLLWTSASVLAVLLAPNVTVLSAVAFPMGLVLITLLTNYVPSGHSKALGDAHPDHYVHLLRRTL